MPKKTTSQQQLLAENAALRARLDEAEATLRAIQRGDVDALVLSGSDGSRILPLSGALEPYRVMIEAMGEGALALESDGTILYGNNRFAEWVKLPREEITGMALQEMIAKKERERFDALLLRGAQEAVSETLTLQAADGTQMPALFSLSPLPQSDGKVISVVIADLSEVAAAAAARSRLALIVDSSDDAIVSTTLDGMIESWNKAAEKLYGYTAKEALGQSLASLTVPPERIHEAMHGLEPIRRGEPTLLTDTVRLRKDGTQVDVSVKASPILDDAGRIIGASINARDISARKRVEAELRESEQAYRTLAHNLPGMVYRVFIREGGRMQFSNAMPAQMTGYAADELIAGEVCSIEPLILDEDRPGVEAEVLRAIAEKRAFAVEYRLRHRDGGIRWMTEHGMPVYGTDDAPLYIDGVIFDITEHKQAEEQLKLFRALLDNSSDAIEVLDPVTLRFLDVNETECRELGYSREELLAMSVFDIDPAFTPELAEDIQEAALRQTGAARFEDGTPAQGRLDLPGGSQLETGRTRQTLYAEHRARYHRTQGGRSMIRVEENVPPDQHESFDGISWWTRSNRIISDNQQFTDMWQVPLGYGPGELTGLSDSATAATPETPDAFGDQFE